MTRERRVVLGVEDINSLLYVCKGCGQEMVCKLDGDFTPGAKCVSCSEVLTTRNHELDPTYTLLLNLRRIKRNANPSVAVRLVVEEEEGEEG